MRQGLLFELDEPLDSGKRDLGSASSDRSTENPADEPVGHGLRQRTVYVVDAHGLIYQSYHAMPEMSSPHGEPIGAVYGFTRDILDLIEKKKPDYLFCAFDAPGDTFRHDLYDEYKANRDGMPDDLKSQIPKIKEVLSGLGVPILSLDGFEADDILATLATCCDEAEATCLLVTHDKDCRQLISDRVKLFNIRRNETFDAAALWQKWGVRPDQVIDYQALVGDKTDNIPGVPLIGPKNAKELLEQFDTLDDLLARVDEVKGKKRQENLREYTEQARLSRSLVALDRQTPIEFSWETGKVGGMNADVLDELCQAYGFRGLAERIATLTVSNAPVRWESDYQLIDSLAALDELAATLKTLSSFSFDTETTNVLPRWAELIGFSFSWTEGQAVYVPIRSEEGRHLDQADVLARLKPILEDPAIGKFGHNLKYDALVLRGAGIKLAGVQLDTMVADYLLSPGERNHSIDDLAKRYFNHQTIKISDLIGSGRNQIRLDQVPIQQVKEYAAEDADIPFRVSDILLKRLDRAGLQQLYGDVEVPLLQVLSEMEWAGIRVNRERLNTLSDEFGTRLEDLETAIYSSAGRRFNVDSRQQLGQVLFEELGLPVLKRTKTGPSTDVDVLQELADRHDLPARVLEYRHFAKLKSTYVDALRELIHPETGRVHTSFRQEVTATGRLSSSDPNLQNIPIRTEVGRQIRSAFEAGGEGWCLLTADYSQIELRILAHYSEDPVLLQAFADDADIHTQVASQVYQVSNCEVTPEMRRAAKAINFGVIYGQTPFGLAKTLRISKDEAAEFIDAYFTQYPRVESYMDRVLGDCRESGYVTTILGRRREVYGVRDPARRKDPRLRTLPERIAINTAIQGSAADLIKIAMLRVHHRLQREQCAARLLLQIHDELILECPIEERDQVTQLVLEEMCQAHPLNVELKVDAKSGPNWADCEGVS